MDSHSNRLSPGPTWRMLTWSPLLIGLCLLTVDKVWASSTRYIVVFQEGTPEAVQQQLLATSHSAVLHRLPLLKAATIQVDAAHSTTVLSALQQRPEVRSIQPDVAITAQSFQPEAGAASEGGDQTLITPALPPEVDGGLTWNLQQVALHTVPATIQGSGIRVAVLDTGIDMTHPALTGMIVGGYNARAGEDPTDYLDRNGHGTHMAGIIAARLLAGDDAGEGPMRGLAPGALLYGVRVLDDAGSGFISDVINGLSWIYAHPEIRVVNMSLGFYKEAPYPLLEQMIQMLYQAGVTLVASAGNYRADCIPVQGASSEGGDSEGGDSEGGDSEGGDSSNALPAPTACNTRVKFPARYPQTIAVAATDSLGHVAPYSLPGTEIAVVAPGGSRLTNTVLSTYTTHASPLPPRGDDDDEGAEDVEDSIPTHSLHGSGSGTSQAAAHVTGLVALLLDVHPGLTPEEVRMIIQTTATDLGVSATRQGAGRIHATRAVNLAQQMLP